MTEILRNALQGLRDGACALLDVSCACSRKTQGQKDYYGAALKDMRREIRIMQREAAYVRKNVK